ncbi:rRNA maturation RNase YbeY [Acetivibrio cellulolyticus]|uniref:rRNA maturation RNase YbeY n=1 Tax=Acetivibrio cellulolyticus TaxID=35830 RepID=UPI0001E2E2B9|nr:rRNA maturation RNase YbeY [Acetivibrio cellulolyticus]
MTVLIEDLQNKIKVSDEMVELVKRAVNSSLEFEKFSIPSEISVMFVDDEGIREINREHRSIDKPTDVLSFPIVDMYEGVINSDDGDFDLDEDLLLLGDIVISLEMTKLQAQEYGHSFERELAFLLTHGVFHLLGYDHDSPEREEKMISKQYGVLEILNLSQR